MSHNQLQILSRVVDRYEADEQPATPAEIANATGTDIEEIRACFDNLEENCLLTTVDDGGYRPTVTARELLELDIDEESLLILDTCPDGQATDG
jgi:predicted transcriptional regulator